MDPKEESKKENSGKKGNIGWEVAFKYWNLGRHPRNMSVNMTGYDELAHLGMAFRSLQTPREGAP